MAKNMKATPFVLDERSRNRLAYLNDLEETSKSATVRRLIRKAYDAATGHEEGTPHAEIKKPPKASQPPPPNTHKDKG